MAKLVDEIMVCSDCLMVIANGDYTGLDLENTPDDPDAGSRRAREIDEGIESFKGYLCAGDSDKDHEFSWSRCECCGSKLGGSRHHVVILD